MSWAEWLDAENCHVLKSTNKADVLHFLIDSLREAKKIRDSAALAREIFYREDLMSTGVSEGIAVPHAQFYEVLRPVVAVGVHPRGIPDYKSPDGKIVRFVVMILVGKNDPQGHLDILKELMTRLQDPSDRETLRRCKTPQEIYAFFC
jgi:mannitol/fructose-specific phosphotransferase system IIA component (Ntr-type)